MAEENGYQLGDYAEKWYQRMWRPSMAAIYMLLCVLDYGVRPMINYYQATEVDVIEIVQEIEDLQPSVQMQIIEQTRQEYIPPILTEFVHLAFGAILGVAAFSRGSQKGFAQGSPNPAPTPAPFKPMPSKRNRNEVDIPEDEADG